MSWNIKTPGDYINGPLTVAGSATITGDLTVDTSTLKVDSTNNRVGIITTTPADILEVVGNGATGIRVSRSGLPTQYATLSAGATGPTLDASSALGSLSFGLAGSTAMTLNSTGLGVGVSPRAKLDVNGGLLVNNYPTSNNYAPLSVKTTSGITTPSTFTNAITIYNTTNVGDYSNITFGYNALGLTNAPAYIGFLSTSSASGGFGDLVFGTRSVGTDTAATERVRIDASGNLLVGVTAQPSGSIGGSGFISDSNSRKQLYLATTSTGSQVLAVFLNPNGSVGTIETNGSATAYNTSSDYRLKESVKPLSGLARVNALKPSVYKWKVDGSAGEGFLAHELAEVVPFAVSGEKDAIDADGKPTYQGVDLSKIVPILVAAIKELTAEVNALKNA